MTEAEWLAYTDPTPMLDFLRSKASDRKLRLFAVACCRRVWYLMTDKQSREAVEVAERYADRLARLDELKAASRDASGVLGEPATPPEEARMSAVTAAMCVADRSVMAAASGMLETAMVAEALGKTNRPVVPRPNFAGDSSQDIGVRTRAYLDAMYLETHSAYCVLLRDIFGPFPFRPPPPLSASVLAWNDGTVRRIAEGIYEERRLPEGTLDAARLAILADALLDAGCDNEELIQHCRSAGPHVRGCWAVDLILGKE